MTRCGATSGPPWFAVSPLMHAAGLWTVFSGTLAGLPVVLYDDRTKFDPASVWQHRRAGEGRHDDDGRATPTPPR